MRSPVAKPMGKFGRELCLDIIIIMHKYVDGIFKSFAKEYSRNLRNFEKISAAYNNRIIIDRSTVFCNKIGDLILITSMN